LKQKKDQSMKIAVWAVALGIASAPALAQQPMPGMPMQNSADSPSTRAFKEADEKMMRQMGAAMTGDADRDFVAGMIPHHQGAIDMAKVELQYGKDPSLRQLAKEIVGAQTKEIALMRAWQAKHK
jgi:uncharacterized protein (DUF305 family)